MEKDELKERLQNAREEQKRLHRERWENLQPFQEPDDIPELPQVSKEEWEKFYVPILLKCGAIPKEELEIDAEYIGSCRNSDTAIWKGNHFEYKRYKLGCYFNDKINHFQDDDGYDLFVPIKKLKNDLQN